MRYSKLYLHGFVRDHDPATDPGTGTLALPHCYEYSAPKYAITREPADLAYLVTHVDSGRQMEVPMANAKGALLLFETRATAAKKGGRNA